MKTLVRTERRSENRSRIARKLIDYYFDGGEIRFFDSRRTWRREARAVQARIVRDGSIDRAWIGRMKIGAFGSLPGHGYLTGVSMANILHGKGPKNGC